MQVATPTKLQVLDTAGNPVNLGDLAAKRPLVVAFLRHFGCLHCLETVVQLRGQLGQVKEAGAELILVGNGNPERAATFQSARAPELRVYTDPTQNSYQALNMKHSVASTLGPRSFLSGLLAILRGHRQTSIQGDPWQQGGLFALAKGGRIVYSQINRHGGDRPDLIAALSSLQSAPNS
ncbi:MAG: peroxiredoxin-like family protein [Candidatus Dormibacteraceae bacterium]